MSNEATAKWTDQCPAKADAGDAYYFVRRKDKLEVVVMGFSMGKGWLNGVSYEPSEMRNHLFLGPITPEQFAEVGRLREALESMKRTAEFALTTPGLIRGRDQLKNAVEAAASALAPH